MTATPHPSPCQIDSWIARSRIAPFLDAVRADHADAMALYVWNARLASSCLESIHHVDVLVRNVVHRELKAGQHEHGLRSWLIDPDLLERGELRAVADVVMRIRRVDKLVTEDRVVAGLPLSFWARLTGTRYDELWKSTLHRAFPHGSGNRKDVAGQLNRISHLRNAVAHHKSLLDVSVADRHRDLLNLAAAVDPAASEWIAGLSQVAAVLAQAPPHAGRAARHAEPLRA